MEYDFPFIHNIKDVPTWEGVSLNDVPSRLERLGFDVLHKDMRTVRKTTKYKIHGVYVIVAQKDCEFYLFTGIYNYLSRLEPKYILQYKIDFNVAMQDMRRWSEWDNPMHDLRESAWNNMWKYSRTFTELKDVKEYISYYMKGFQDIGTTLVWARGSNE